MELRKHLSAKGLLGLVREEFKKINPRVLAKRSAKPIELVDCLMSGLAIFSLKFSSLLQFEEQSKEINLIKRNLRTLYQIEHVPSDTYLRERLDEVNPREIRKIFKKVFSQVQRGKALEAYSYLDGHYLMPMDMTGFFSSPNVHCENCCVKQHNRPKLTFVNDEPTSGEDFKSHTYILFGDMISGWKMFYVDGSHEISEISLNRLPLLQSYLLGQSRRHLKPSHITEIKKLIDEYHEEHQGSTLTYAHTTDDGKTHRYRYINNVPLNRNGIEINFIEYWEKDKKGDVKHFNWVTDIEITKENIYQLMKGGRSNWQIENNTFNTLKNQGYHFSHNFGHGYQHLCTVFGMLMMLAFTIDQIQERCCDLFKSARNKFRTRIALWQKMRSLFLGYAIANGYKEAELVPDTS